MSDQSRRGILCEGLDAAFEAEETRASNLILDARLLHDRQQPDAAAPKYAQAAEIEERLGDLCESKGLIDKAWVHRFSAVRCWALAGNIHDAISLGDALLARPDLPERLRQRVHEYTQDLRQRRAQWFAGLVPTATSAAG